MGAGGRRLACRLWCSAGLALGAALAAPAMAQRAGDNVLTSAQDAFGTVLGRENFGIYTTTSVRGFSPTDAGNNRIMGLYFDQIGLVTRAARMGSNVRVGLGTLESPFPAPTGIVDNSLRVPSDKGLGSATGGIIDQWKLAGDFEKEINLSPHAGVTVSMLGELKNIMDGDPGRAWAWGLTGLLKPVDGLEIIPFTSGRVRYEEVAEARWFTRDREQPVKRRDRLTNIGPLWANGDETNTNHGAIIKLRAIENWDLDAGLFLATQDRRRNHSILVRDIDDMGIGTREVVSDPDQWRRSWSGEVRLTRQLNTGRLSHKLIASYRGRRAYARIGGNDRVNLGRFDMNARVEAPQAKFNYRPQIQDRVKMDVLSAGYEGQWGPAVHVAGGVQFMDYSKKIDQPGQPLIEQRDKPMLLNGIASVQVTPRVVAYAAFTQGLEETSAAPPEAVNRNDLLPAQRTEQLEAGVRLRLPRRLTLNLSAFRIEKPLFALDDLLVFRERGALRHQGLEASLAGSPVPGLTVLLGGLYLDAKNSGPEVAAGRIGAIPVGRPKVSGRMAINWRLDGGRSPWSFDLVIDGEGRSQATRDNLVQAPGGIDIDIGARYRFKMGKQDATLRLLMTEVTNSHRWTVAGDGAWQTNFPRAVTAQVTVNI